MGVVTAGFEAGAGATSGGAAVAASSGEVGGGNRVETLAHGAVADGVNVRLEARAVETRHKRLQRRISKVRQAA